MTRSRTTSWTWFAARAIRRLQNRRACKDLIQLGASPRATIALTLASKAYAFLRGRGYVTPQDVKSIGMDVLRHRVDRHLRGRSRGKDERNDHSKIFNELPVP
jgi:MoxR-like ATPase